MIVASRYIGVVTLSITALLIVGIVFIALYVLTNLPSQDTFFCEESDLVYQEISENAQQWLEQFDDANQSLQFTLPNDPYRKYTVRLQLPGDENNLLYVSTGFWWSNSLEGSKGYIYSQSGNIPTGYWTQEYNIQPLDENIFCYSKSTFVQNETD